MFFSFKKSVATADFGMNETRFEHCFMTLFIWPALAKPSLMTSNVCAKQACYSILKPSKLEVLIDSKLSLSSSSSLRSSVSSFSYPGSVTCVNAFILEPLSVTMCLTFSLIPKSETTSSHTKIECFRQYVYLELCCTQAQCVPISNCQSPNMSAFGNYSRNQLWDLKL